MSARRGRTLFVVVLLVVAGVAPALAATGETDALPTERWRPAADASPSDGTLTQQAATTLGERIVASRNDDPGSVTLTFAYRIPDAVSGLRVAVPVLSLSGITVEGTDGFEREGETRFRWDTETERPSVSLRLAVGDTLGDGVRGVERDGWALVSQPNTRMQVRADTQPVRTTTFGVADSEPGYASSHLAYLGEHERRNVTAADENATFVLGATDANATRATTFLRTANEHFDFGVRHDRITVFVLPVTDESTANVDAATVDTAFWVGESGLRLDETGAVFSHEYVHTRLGTVGTRDATWLNEGSAEYYGHLFALNDGVGTYESFRADLQADAYAPDNRSVVLSDPQTWTGTTAHYDKGAHVLAALDAEIRRRTNEDRTLRDVFSGRSEPFADYQAFRGAVIEVADDESLGPWLDRYVTTDALPPLPDNPRYYVAAPELDPDSDGTASGAEVDRGQHPFVAGAGPDGIVATETDPTTASTTAAETEGENTGTESEEETGTARTNTEGSAPGFGVGAGVAAVALLVCGALCRRRE
ncbi:hypothetical protein ACOZ4L_01375 [Haloplanus ruber]|uniref:PGF-CTERM sorting domain-containing protein n=1 Tax=Haloplanus ruber TaxID=869892 RepID=A0ABD6D169_9EURY|nr:hypothetical protein [Haloplanus ruber]